MKSFGLIGAAGFIAPRHMRAIKDTGNDLVAACDPKDSVGIIDSYFPDAHFFIEFERFDRHIDKLRRRGSPIDYLSVCSPNYLHDAHVRFGLRSGASVICEKPLVLNPWNLDALKDIEAETSQRIHTILQLRLHPAIAALRQHVAESSRDSVFDVDLAYITSRGRWYHTSWKGAIDKSGGIATNIGIHFFDMLIWVFGAILETHVHVLNPNFGSGFLRLEKARVRWFLSIDAAHVPQSAKDRGKRTFRSITISGEDFEFSEGFTELHTASYADILAGGGFSVEDVRPSIELAHAIRNAPQEPFDGTGHPYATALCSEAASV